MHSAYVELRFRVDSFMYKKKLLIVSPLPDELIDLIEQRFPYLCVVDCRHNRERIIEEIETAHYFFGRPTRDQFLRAKQLEFIQVWTQGVEGILYPELVNSDVLVSNGRGIWSPAIAEHILAFILAHFRSLAEYFRFQRDKRWIQKDVPLRRLFGKTVCFLGTGDIAQHTVQLLQGFCCRILGVNRHGNCPAGFHEVVRRDRMLSILPQADIIVCALPFTEETRHFVDSSAFLVMKKTAFFVNVGRGKTVDETALISALQDGRIAGAGLDVLETEPPEKENPLWGMPNVMITAHIAGLDEEHALRAFDLLCDNLQRLHDGITPRNLVDKARGY